jgi:tetratricopeptide (TPR) repeat protein
MAQGLAPGWRGSPAHVFLLGSFLRPWKVEDLPPRLNWEKLLGEAPTSVVEQFLAAGLLQAADEGQSLAERLEQRTVKELQELLRARDLPVSGRKDNLIARLIEADPVGMEEAVREQSPVCCTDEGVQAVVQYLTMVQVEPPSLAGDAEPIEMEEATTMTAADHLKRGLGFGQQGDYDKALAEFSRAVELNPSYARAHYWRGVVLERIGDHARALMEFHQAIALDAERADAYIGRGDAYRQLGDYRMAILEYNAGIRRDPSLAIAYHNRGVAHEALGDLQQALGDYDKAVELDPASAEPYFGRGVIYAHAGDYERAAEQFKQCIRLTDDDQVLAAARERLGRVQMVL